MGPYHNEVSGLKGMPSRTIVRRPSLFLLINMAIIADVPISHPRLAGFADVNLVVHEVLHVHASKVKLAAFHLNQECGYM